MASSHSKGARVPVALVGRVPLKTSVENGSIKVGDRLTVSSTPGVAMKATEPGMTVGYALESLDNVSPGSYQKILTFINISYWAPDIDSIQSEELAINGSTVNDNLIFNAVISMFKDIFNIVFENGLMKVAQIVTDKLVAKEICIEEVCVNKEQLKLLLERNSTYVTPTPSPSITPESMPALESTPEPSPN